MWINIRKFLDTVSVNHFTHFLKKDKAQIQSYHPSCYTFSFSILFLFQTLLISNTNVALVLQHAANKNLPLLFFQFLA